MLSLSAQLEKLERLLLDYGTRSVAESAGALLAPDVREFGKSGRSWDRDDIIASLAAETTQIDYQLRDFTAKRLGEDFVLATYALHIRAPDGTTAKSLRSSVWQHEAEGIWRMLFHQGTAAQ